MAQIKKSTGLGDWFEQRLAVKKVWNVLAGHYWIPKNISFLWAMGVILTTLFVLLLISGLMLMSYYKPDAFLAFDSVNKTIMQEVNYGWLWRHIHAIGASVSFLIIYVHLLTGIYYRSYKNGREMIWLSGILLLVLYSAEAFSGYMLPWGQMSYWAAQVITQLFGGIPFIGDALVEWIRGDYAVSDPTLTRFFMLHVVLMPLLILVGIVLHFYALRVPHVNNLTGEEIDFDLEGEKYLEGKTKESKVIPFWPGFLAKDFFYVCIFMVFFFYLVGFNFGFAMDPINFDPANSLKTPTHIYPEWYFLWEYEILRGFFFDVGPLKAADIGLMGFGFSMISLAFIPWLDRNSIVAPAHESKGFFIWFWLLIIDLILLSIFGKLPVDGTIMGISNTYIGFVLSIIYILQILVVLPLVTISERKKRG
ncbi:MAG: cytochrome bc complex cytochrome b subunit [Campylobacter sp.]|nr:cytochrome bc complex cytochrome b subunit [Campylobacter sp.]